MKTRIPTADLKLADIPEATASNTEIIRFAQSLNGYQEVGGEASNLGRYIQPLRDQPFEAIPLNDLRILLFARQRAHYHQGGGWGDDDPVMDEMRSLVAEIRKRFEDSADT